jgi:hypothetical protein
MSSADEPSTARSREDEMSDNEPVAAGWHSDQQDPTTARYWNGRRWTGQRRWSGTEWLDVPLVASAGAEALPPPQEVPAAPAAGATNGGVGGRFGAAFGRTSTTFRVFVGAAVACVLGYFVPVTTVTSDAGYSETRSLSDAGGYGVLILAAAAATIWIAWPTRYGGVVSRRALWGLGGMVAIIALFTTAVFSALGSNEEDLIIMTASKTVEPGLGLFLLVAAAAAQVVGIVLAIRDRRRMQPRPDSARQSQASA